MDYKNNNLKIIALICIFVFISSFTFVKAEENKAPDSENTAQADSSETAGEVTEVQAVSSLDGASVLTDSSEKETTSQDSISAEASAVNNSIGQIDVVEPGQSETPVIDISGNNMEQAQISSDAQKTDSSDTSETAVDENVDKPAEILTGEESHSINTGIIRNLSLNNLTVVADWQMSVKKTDGSYAGEDDSADSAAQFLPSGQFQVNKPLMICALVGDADSAVNITAVKATVNYPENIAASQYRLDEGSGCGRIKSEIDLSRLDKKTASGLLCAKLRNDNNNLLNWNPSNDENIAFGFEQACGEGGYIESGNASLFCGETALAYDDPAGNYKIKITAENNSGSSAISENYFKYLELTTFENDFTDIQYGPVKLDNLKILNGDLAWSNGTKPTIRNTGNTRLQIKIKQNDFGFGKTAGEWNISYQARVGSDADFVNYPPEQITTLNKPLNIGETANMDFGALISRFPDKDSGTAFWGNMVLAADKVPPLTCQ